MNQRARRSGSIKYAQTVSIGASSMRSNRSIAGVNVSWSAMVILRCARETVEDHRPAVPGLLLVRGPFGVHLVCQRDARSGGGRCVLDRHASPLALFPTDPGEACTEQEDLSARTIDLVELQMMFGQPLRAALDDRRPPAAPCVALAPL